MTSENFPPLCAHYTIIAISLSLFPLSPSPETPTRFSLSLSSLCMAANSTGRVLSSGGFGKRFVGQIWTSGNPAVASPASRRAVHASSYDKNVEEHVRPAVVPDDVIDAKSSDKYWGPHPSTGVFGPAGDDSGAASAGRREGAGVSGPGGAPSVLEQTAWFRPLEDVDKPPHA